MLQKAGSNTLTLSSATLKETAFNIDGGNNADVIVGSSSINTFTSVETIAELLAESVLLHERVKSVTVQVEKLDVAPGAVGVKIRRERSANGRGKSG